MSTSYYTLKFPITSLKVTMCGGGTHAHLQVFVCREWAGTLIIKAEELNDVLLLFANREYDDRVLMRTHYGGKGVGCVVTERPGPGILDPELILISENGELLTVAQIRAMGGAGK